MNCRLVVTADVGVPAWMWPLLTKSRHTITFLLNPTDFLFRKKLQKNRAELCSSSSPLKAQPSASGVDEITDDAAALWIILTTYRQGIFVFVFTFMISPRVVMVLFSCRSCFKNSQLWCLKSYYQINLIWYYFWKATRSTRWSISWVRRDIKGVQQSCTFFCLNWLPGHIKVKVAVLVTIIKFYKITDLLQNIDTLYAHVLGSSFSSIRK